MLPGLVNVNKKRTGKIHHVKNGKLHELSFLARGSWIANSWIERTMAELVYPQKITFFHNKTPPHFDCFNPTIYIARTHSRWNPKKRMVPRFFSMAMVIFGSLRSFFHHGNGEIHLHFHGICLDYQSGNHQKWAYKLNTSLVYKSLKI
jgi:hypothetical protein